MGIDILEGRGINTYRKEKDFLLDPTYIQFFSTETCNESNYMISKRNPNLVLLTPSPGYFINEEENQIILDFKKDKLENTGYMIKFDIYDENSVSDAGCGRHSLLQTVHGL